jgi:RNA polymerase sigma-32 factor
MGADITVKKKKKDEQAAREAQSRARKAESKARRMNALSSVPPARLDSVTRYDPLDAFLREIQRYPLLTREEEKELATHYTETGDVQAAAQLVTSNLRLVVKIAFEYRRAYQNIMDLIQEGNIGLMQAVKKYDPSRGVKLSSYAAWWIRAYIMRFVLNNWRLVKLGTTQAQRKLFFNLNKERSRLTALGETPTHELLAERLGVTVKEVVEMEQRLKGHDLSLNAEISDSEGRPVTHLDMIADDDDLQDVKVQGAKFSDALGDRLSEFLEPLTDKESYIFEQRLIVDEPQTLQQIGDRFGISRERVRQIEKRLLGKLRTYLVHEMPEYFNDGYRK